jgi:hypothetical protein
VFGTGWASFTFGTGQLGIVLGMGWVVVVQVRDGLGGHRSGSGRAQWASFRFGTGWLGVVCIRARRRVLGVEPSSVGSVSTHEGGGGMGSQRSTLGAAGE